MKRLSPEELTTLNFVLKEKMDGLQSQVVSSRQNSLKGSKVTLKDSEIQEMMNESTVISSIMEKASGSSQESLSLTTPVEFLANKMKAIAFINTSIDENIIYLREMMEMNNTLYMSTHGDPYQPLCLSGYKAMNDGLEIYYESRLKVIINGDEESHMFQFRIHNDPSYIVELGLSAIRGRIIQTK